ncbi:MAG TPA: hypothetical protein VG452_05935 [Egibacteraceae bacterium]|nr:hypothetical protein [Egibacteraceae bacterium]
MASQRGDVILNWLLKLVVGLTVAGVVLIDAGAIGINALQLQDAADQAVHAAVTSWRADRSSDDARRAVLDSIAEQPAVALLELAVGDGRVTVTVSRPARVLVAHRIGPLTRYVERTVSKTSALPG